MPFFDLFLLSVLVAVGAQPLSIADHAASLAPIPEQVEEYSAIVDHPSNNQMSDNVLTAIIGALLIFIFALALIFCFLKNPYQYLRNGHWYLCCLSPRNREQGAPNRVMLNPLARVYLPRALLPPLPIVLRARPWA